MAWEVCVGLLLVVPLVLFLLDRRAHNYWKRRGVFQLDPIFFFGNVKDILLSKKPLVYMVKEIYREHKDKKLVGFYSFYRRMLIVTEPALAKEVLTKNFRSFSGAGNELEGIDPLMALNPFSTIDFHRWKERRAIHVALNTNTKLRLIPGYLLKSGHSMQKYISGFAGKPIYVRNVAELFTIEAIVIFAYGLKPSAFEDPEYAFAKHAKDTAFSPRIEKTFEASILYPFIGRLQSLRFFSKEFQDFFTAFTSQALAQREEVSSTRGDILDAIIKMNSKFFSKEFQDFFTAFTSQALAQREEVSSTRGDILDAIIKMNSKLASEGKKVLEESLQTGHVVIAYLDSVFTTSSALQMVLLELAINPKEQELTREEILAAGDRPEDFDSMEKIGSLKYLQMVINDDGKLSIVFQMVLLELAINPKEQELTREEILAAGDRPEDFDSMEKIRSLKYLQMVINETLRKHLAMPLTVRLCSKATELGGVRVEQGTKVFIPPGNFHMDPDFFPDPEEFRPERFADWEDSGGTFLPFGGGPRMCVGSRYAQIVIKMALIFVLLKFRVMPGGGVHVKDYFPDNLFFTSPHEMADLLFLPI